MNLQNDPVLDLLIVTLCLGHFLALRLVLVLEPLYVILSFDLGTLAWVIS